MMLSYCCLEISIEVCLTASHVFIFFLNKQLTDDDKQSYTLCQHVNKQATRPDWQRAGGTTNCNKD